MSTGQILEFIFDRMHTARLGKDHRGGKAIHHRSGVGDEVS